MPITIEEFKRKYDKELKDLGFIYEREEETETEPNYFHLIYEKKKKPGFSTPMEGLFVFNQSKELDGIVLTIPIKLPYPHPDFYTLNFSTSVDDLIYFLKKGIRRWRKDMKEEIESGKI